MGICFFYGRAGAVQRRAEDSSAALLNAGAIDALAVEGDGVRAARQWAADLGGRRPSVLHYRSGSRPLEGSFRPSLRPALESDSWNPLRRCWLIPDSGPCACCSGGVDDEGIVEAINDVRLAARRHGASVVVEVCHPSIKVNLDVWGPEPPGMELMRRIKEQLDPQRLLNRGRFIGRI